MQKEDGSQAFWLKYLWGSLESADLAPHPWDRAVTQSCVSRSLVNACPPGIMTPVLGGTTGACLLGVGGHTGGRAKGLSWSSTFLADGRTGRYLILGLESGSSVWMLTSLTLISREDDACLLALLISLCLPEEKHLQGSCCHPVICDF